MTESLGRRNTANRCRLLPAQLLDVVLGDEGLPRSADCEDSHFVADAREESSIRSSASSAKEEFPKIKSEFRGLWS